MEVEVGEEEVEEEKEELTVEEEGEGEGLEGLVRGGWDGGDVGGEGGEGENKLRVVRIGEVDVYPCGGTHVERTDLCGKVGVRKIARQKGGSRVGYTVD